MNKRNQIIVLLAIGHLALVGLGAAGVAFPDRADGGVPAVEWYRHFTGANNSFEFFAPGVGPQERVRFVFADEQGREWTDDLELGRNREANLSFTTIPFVLAGADDETAWSMLRSMAVAMLRRNPSAVHVEVRVESFGIERKLGDGGEWAIDFPSMQQYRSGVRPEWILLYQLTFNRFGEAIEPEDIDGGMEQ